MQYDVYRNPSPRSRDEIPYLLDVQAELLEDLATRMVIPLVRLEVAGKPLRILTPIFEIEQQKVVLSVPEISGVPVKALGEKVGSLAAERDSIVAALDLLLTGA
jgi:toxin CcdB